VLEQSLSDQEQVSGVDRPVSVQHSREELAMRHTWLDRRLLGVIQKIADPVPIRMGLGPSSEEPLPSSSTFPVVRLKDRKTLIALLLSPEIAFGDLYSQGDIEIDGDLVRLLETLYERPRQMTARAASRWLGWMQSNSVRAARRNIRHHYDIPGDFYRLWLDPQLVYTCAYFPHENASLEEAQRAKLDLVCRKLWLRPGETVVEAGCGWGALAIHMAKHYGVRVKAFNISHEQIEFARQRARQERLASAVDFCEDDYRNIGEKFDVFVSVGMLEHVGREHYAELGRVIHRAIGDRGRGLLHFIGRNRPRAFSAWMRKRIFPGAYAPSLREAINITEPHNFSVLDIENLRAHYAKTLECWLSRFERSYDRVRDRFGPNFARMWRLYLAGSLVGFRVGTLQLFQMVFAGRKCDSLPWTRDRLYTNATNQTGQDPECIHAMS
jgi:cyclopropane-fatty-acyl-phospholipid synthase